MSDARTAPATDDTPILAARDLTVTFGDPRPGHGGTVAVDQVSLTLPAAPPRILSIVGESGSGKTTVARTLLGLTARTGGAAEWRGHDIGALDAGERDAFREDVQAVFQDPYGIYNPYYRVDRVFNLAIKKFKLAATKPERQALIEDALRAVNLRPPDVLGRHPHQLSGGERQRLMLARAYLLRPKVIIADEPISMLDVAVRATLMNVFLDFKERYGMSTIFITHDLSAAYYLAGEIMVMARGRVVEAGPVEDVMRQPAHPYTQLLLQSIPSPDPDQGWDHLTRSVNPAPTPELAASRNRCLFAERCPHVMPRCWTARPPMYEVGTQRATCFLHEAGAGAAVAQRTA